MADVVRCSNCGSRIYALQLSSGTRIELNATPDPKGQWAFVNGEPVPAYEYKAGQPVARRKGFENAQLFKGHYGNDCANAAAARVTIKPKTGTGS